MRGKIHTSMICLLAASMAGCGDSGGGGTTPDSRDPSVARQWNEVILTAIRNDFARPTVHARNLFHSSAAMFDAWSAYTDEASTWLLGSEVDGFSCALAAFTMPEDVHLACKTVQMRRTTTPTFPTCLSIRRSCRKSRVIRTSWTSIAGNRFR